MLTSEAHVKITCRLVPDQRPADVLARLRRHLQRHCPPGVTLSMEDGHEAARAYRLSPESPAVQAAAETLAEVFGQTPEFVGMGGTIPIVTTFREVLGVDTVFFSFSTADENIHAPNEFYRPDRFRKGLQAWPLPWRRLSRSPCPASPHAPPPNPQPAPV